MCRYATVHVNTGALSELFSSGKAGTPVITQLASGELLLAKDNIGIFIGTDGKPSRKVLSSHSSCSHCFAEAYYVMIVCLSKNLFEYSGGAYLERCPPCGCLLSSLCHSSTAQPY